MKYDQETWLNKAKLKYKDRFSYEDTVYIDSYHKVNIRCIEHDILFEVSPISFIRKSTKGNFCPKCKHNKKLTPQEFLKKARKNWGELYNFDKSEFKTTRDDIIVICPEHGEFTKRAGLFSSKPIRILCDKCISELSYGIFDRLNYFIENPELGVKDGVFYQILVTHKDTKLKFLKIGITSYSLYQRYDYTRYDDFSFEVIDEIFDTMLNVAKIEKEYKKKNKLKRFFIPKDIKFNGRTECYIVNENIQLRAKQIKFIRDGLLIKQNGVCAICKRSPEMPTLDHYHSSKHNGSGLVRGVLCNQCNRFLGVIENNLSRNCIDFSDAPAILRNIADYVLSEKEPYIHPTEALKPKKLKKRSYNVLKKRYDGRAKFPPYPKNGRLTKPLIKLFEKYNIKPNFYS